MDGRAGAWKSIADVHTELEGGAKVRCGEVVVMEYLRRFVMCDETVRHQD